MELILAPDLIYSGKMVLNNGMIALGHATTMLLKWPLVGNYSSTWGLKVDEIVSKRLIGKIVRL
jgi:hypothetical protein